MHLFNVYPVFDITPVRGEGSYIYDDKGNAYLDFYGGHAVISIGHAHPHYVKRIEEQLHSLPFYSNSINNPLQEELAAKLGELSGLEEYSLFLCNSGAEANENALKLASFRTKKSKIISFSRGFHGRTSAAVNSTSNDKIKAPINKHNPVEIIPHGDLAATAESLVKGDVAAVIIEGVQGIGGIYPAGEDFLRALSKLCKENGVLLILDEIQCGYGRSGHFFAYQTSGIEPDLITVAKGMGNGFPMGGVLIHPGFEAWYGMLGTTFGGNHLACAAGLAVLEVIDEENLIARADKWGKVLSSELSFLPGVKEVRAAGLMIGLEFDYPIKTLRKSLIFEEHFFTGSSSEPNTLRLLPPLNIQEKEVDQAIKALTKAAQKHKNNEALHTN